MADAIQEAENSLFIAAAGNDFGNDNDSNPIYPASYDLNNIISVAANDEQNNLAAFSNYGLTTVDISAPGVEIYSQENECHAKYSYETRIMYIPFMDMPSTIKLSSGIIIPGPIQVFEASLKQLPLLSEIFHLKEYNFLYTKNF